MKQGAGLYHFFHKRPFVLAALMLCITALLVFFARHLKMEEDISKFLPADKNSVAASQAFKQLKIKDKFLILIQDQNKAASSAELGTVADELADSLKTHCTWYLRDIRYKVNENTMHLVYAQVYKRLPIYLSEADYARIERNLTKDSIEESLAADYHQLLSPSGMVLGQYIIRDPLQYVSPVLARLQDLQFDAALSVHDGYIQTEDGKSLLLFLTPSVSASDYEQNSRFITQFEGILKSLRQKYPNTEFGYYGSAPVSTGNSSQIRKDTFLTSLLALSLIIGILLWYFRRVSIILLILVPVVFGGLFSLSMLYLFRGEISIIAIGAGSIILGIAINYSLHFFTHYRHEPDPEKVVKDLATPMLIGCGTTVAAFFSLQFTSSPALHDFGWFAGFSLIGALVFSIVVLPHLLKRFSGNSIQREDPKFITRIVNFEPSGNKILLLSTLILTLIFLYKAPEVAFESDMMNMNYQDAQLTRTQKKLDSLTRNSQRSIYALCSGTSQEQVLRKNEQLYAQLQSLKAKDDVKLFSSSAQLLLSDSLQALRIERWKAFWTPQRKSQVLTHLKEAAATYHFKPDAFSDFQSLIEREYTVETTQLNDSLYKQVLPELINSNDSIVSLVTMIKAGRGEQDSLYALLTKQSGLLVFDRQHMTASFIAAISQDFNLILMITALLVFGFMLLSHGRIELAVINFLPMAVSWIWILGIMAIFGLKFNIINIIISTFIFGLGDDYSIFIMDGLSNQYRTGKKTLASYKTSILLSATTNIVGIGVLIFAQHPALRSIAAITIIGMCTVLFVSFVVQPVLFEFMLLGRKKKGLPPLTAFSLLLTVIGFVVFLVGSILLSVFGLLLFYVIPAPKYKKKYLFHLALMGICRLMMYLFVNVKKNIENPNQENFSKPAVLIANHQSHIDLAFLLMLHPKIVVFTNDWVWNSPFYGFIVRKADFYPASRGYETALDKMRELRDQGYSILIFPEGTRSETGDILRFHKGAFYLAEQLQMDLLPILMHGNGDVLPKKDFHFRDGSLTLRFLNRIAAADKSYGDTYTERSKSVCKLMRQDYATLRSEKEQVSYFRPALLKNYIFKGPVLEWYARIKTGMEDNYRLFDQELPRSGHITDVGCGYGFISLMLSLKSPQRTITGVDYDEDKIAVANNCHSRSERVHFFHEDVRTFKYQPSDAFVISDVLHYLPHADQEALVENCIQHLNPGGTMIIRDGDAAKQERHKGTRLTEFFSTNIGFNKTSEGHLHFAPASLIENVLKRHKHLQYRIVDETKYTSNIIFVVNYPNA